MTPNKIPMQNRPRRERDYDDERRPQRGKKDEYKRRDKHRTRDYGDA